MKGKLIGYQSYQSTSFPSENLQDADPCMYLKQPRNTINFARRVIFTTICKGCWKCHYKTIVIYFPDDMGCYCWQRNYIESTCITTGATFDSRANETNKVFNLNALVAHAFVIISIYIWLLFIKNKFWERMINTY